MEPREIWAPKQRFKSLDLLLGLSDCSLQGRCLTICCSEAIAEKLKVKLDILLLRFGQLESIFINDEVVYRFLPVVLDPPKREVRLERVEIDLTKCVKIPFFKMKRD